MPLLSLLAMNAMMVPPKLQAQPFPLGAIKVLAGPFVEANKPCADYLLEIEPDRLLHNFRKNAGLEPKGKIYGGWENSGLAGHSLGHYLSACAQQYASTKDRRYKANINYIIDELVACQKARPDGCISAIPNGDKVWDEIRKGEIRSKGFDLNGLWSPWYTHHKVFAGLLDAQALAGNQKALGVAEKFADWAIELTKGFSDAQWQEMLGTEYGGMNESLAELYARTGKAKYLEIARKFYDRKVLDPLAAGKDELQGKHSNTQIPKLVGLARLYEITGEEKDRKAAEFFWKAIVKDHTYAIGGNSNHEYLGPPGKLSDRLSTNTAETCNTYNMLRLTRHLFEWEPKAEYADFYERAYLNHILASQNKDGMMTYFMPLSSGSSRRYSNKFNDFTCCHGSGIETHTKHGDSAYFFAGKEKLWVNLFMPSTVLWKETGVTVTQQTSFPDDFHTFGENWKEEDQPPTVGLSFSMFAPRAFELLIRHPGWMKQPLEVMVGNKIVARSTKPSSYVSVKRTWNDGDELKFVLRPTLHTESMPDNKNRVAVMYGPYVLAAEMLSPRIPVLVNGGRPVAEWLLPVPGKPLEFRTVGVGRPEELVFRPFYEHKQNRYATYFDQFDEARWKRLEAEFRAEEERVKDLEARTIDYVRIGEMQPERDHKLKSEKNDVRESNGRGFRTPLAGGWFEFEMKVDPAKPVDLVMTYWGSDRSDPSFEILVDGVKLVMEDLPSRKPNLFFDEARALPEMMTKGKSSVTIRVQAIPGKAAAAVAGARTIFRK
ncbi:MAG: beta-L-arabinofuranosidase domain-containing protein [Fimbriimonas sp.]